MPLPLEITVVCPTLIGRTRYLASLDQLVKRAAKGAGQLILLVGEAGIGKSRLTQELIKGTSGHQFQVLIGHGFEPDRKLPFAAILDLLRDHWSEFAPEKLKQTLTDFKDLADLDQLLPEFKLSFPENNYSAQIDPEQQKRRLLRAISNYFTRLATSQPLLIIFEDLHWCDDNTLEFLQQFTRQITSKPIVILLTYRNDELNLTPNHFLARIDQERVGHEFLLNPLNQVEIGEMIREIFKLARPVRPEFLELLHSLSEGNPFFIEEILRSLLAAGEQITIEGNWDKKSLQELHIPRSIQAAVQRRSEKLSPAAQPILALAAVIGRSFDFDLLNKLTGEPEQSLLKLVRELIEAQLVVEEEPEQLVFRHALTREAIYKQLLGRERKNLHQQIAKALEELHTTDPEFFFADLAYHYFEAGEWAKAYEYAWKSGLRTQALYAPKSAIEYFEKALHSAARTEIKNIQLVYRARGKTFETLGDFERAREDHELALGLSRKLLNRVDEWQSLLDLGMLWVGRDYKLAGEYYQQAFSLASQTEDRVCLAYSLNCLGNWHLNIEEPQEARHCQQEALAIFQSLNNREGLAETLDLLGMTCCLGGDLILAHSYYRQAIALFRELKDRNRLISSLASVSLCGPSLQTNTMIPANIRIEDAIAEGQTAIKLSQEIGKRSDEAFASIMLVFSYGMAGEYTQALKIGEEALAIAEEIKHRQWLTASHYALGTIYLEMLGLTAAIQHLEKSLTLAQEIGSSHWTRCAAARLSRAYTALKNFDLAEKILGQVLDSDTPMQTLGQRLAWQSQAELDFARGNFQSVINITEELVKSAANVDSRGEPLIPEIACLRARAMVELVIEAGSLQQSYAREAEKTFLSIQLEATRQELRGILWHALGSQARLYYVLKHPEAAGELLVQARAVIKNLAEKIIDRTQKETFLAQTKQLLPGATPAIRKRLAKAEIDQLTVREVEVVGLIALGKSTRIIAQELVLSERTVETHISNVLAKLGFNSRVQLAAWAIENGLRNQTK